MINLERFDIAELSGVTLRGGTEKAGPCPKCGGKDRFHVKQHDGKDFCCCSHCHGRAKWIDGIDFLRWINDDDRAVEQTAQIAGVSRDTAARFIAVRVKTDSGEFAANALRARFSTDTKTNWRGNRHTSTPKAKPVKPVTETGIEIPRELDPPPAEEWQAGWRAFVDSCEVCLWSETGAKALAYLRKERGFNNETIRGHQLGFCPEDNYARGTHRGITIPIEYADALWGINTRRATGEPKYKKVAGSKAQLFNGDTLTGDNVQAVLVCAGEFDCLLAQQYAPPGVACVTYGSEGKKASWELDYLLRGKPVFVAFDNDDAGDNYAKAWAAIGTRVRVPSGKDITDYWRAGGDLGAWIAETTNFFPWQPSDDEDWRVAQAKSWLEVFDDESQDDFVRARAWARVCVCMGESVTSDGKNWLALAQ